MKRNKREDGITLIVLVITIIVLLILTGITIAALTGNNGIISEAGNAKEQTEISQEKEIIDISTVEAMGKNNRGNLEEEEFQNALNDHANGKVSATDIGEEFEVFFEESNRYYIVNKDGDISNYGDFVVDKAPGDLIKDENGTDIEEGASLEIWCIEDLLEWSKNSSAYQNLDIILCRNLNFKSKFSYSDSKRTDYGDINCDGKTESLIQELQSGIGFTPINEYKAKFNGQGNAITNIYQNNDSDIGLFKMCTNVTIENLRLTGYMETTTTGYAGGIMSYSNHTTSFNCNNCSVNIEIVANNASHVGGLVGRAGTINITQCFNEGNIEGKNAYTGGLSGIGLTGSIDKSYNVGHIIGNNSGGILGYSYYPTPLIITNSYNVGTVEGSVARWNSRSSKWSD